MSPAPLAAVLLGTLVLATPAAAGVVIPWTAAGEHVRRLVTVEGVVARATTTAERRCVLEFDPHAADALRVVMTIPLITDLPADPSRLYAGKRVQVTGRVTRFQNRLEMLVTPAQIDVVGLTALPPPAALAPATPAGVPTPQPAGAAPPSAPPSEPSPPPLAVVDPRCAGWHTQRAAIRAELRALAHELDACLAGDRAGCADIGDRLGPPLSRLAEVEQRLGVACP